MKRPDYLYRPTDYSIFKKIDNGKYVHMEYIKQGCFHEYSYESLMNCNFLSCTEDDFIELKKNHDLYYEYLSWSTRSDGHGGSKGGTMAEFLQIKNKNITATENHIKD